MVLLSEGKSFKAEPKRGGFPLKIKYIIFLFSCYLFLYLDPEHETCKTIIGRQQISIKQLFGSILDQKEIISRLSY